MATVIRKPHVGAYPRRVATDKSNSRSQKLGREDEQQDEASKFLHKVKSHKTGIEIEHTQKQCSDSESDLLEVNPIAEALKHANARTAEVESRLEELRNEIDQKRKEASEKGFIEGRMKGLEQGLEEYRKKIQILDEVVKQVNHRIDSVMEEAEEAAVELSFSALGKILFGQLVNREMILHVVRNLKEGFFYDTKKIVVHVSQEDLDLLSNSMDEKDNLPEGIRFVADERVKYGGCIVEADNGNMDARLEVQLQELLELYGSVRRQGRKVSS